MAGANPLAFLKNAQRLMVRDDRPNGAGEFRRVSLYRTGLKYPYVRLEQTLQRLPSGQEVTLTENAEAADHVVVRALPGVAADEVRRLAAQNGDTVLKPMRTPGYYLVQLPGPEIDAVPVAMQALGHSSQVISYVEPDQVAKSALVPNDPDFSQEWNMNNTGQTGGTAHADINAASAWSVIHGSPNVVVAVIDTGIDFNHPDLSSNIWTNPHPGSLTGYAADTHGWNFYADNNTPQDDNFHGTHVSGTIGAVGNNGTGVAGVTWQVEIMPLKFLGPDGTGYTSDAVDAVNYATAMGAKIISNSWGGIVYSQALKDAIDAANAAGVLFVVAAGNDGVDIDQNPDYPASYTSANIITVAATDNSDHLASFSNYGTGGVHVAAPGVGILSTLPTVATAAMINEGLTTNYGQLSGTSMATPLVSGAAALALAQNSSLTVAQLKSQIIQRTDSLAQLSGLIQSSGRLDLYNIVNTSWSPGAAVVEVQSTIFDDSEGDHDGTANPGEIIHLTPVLHNVGQSAAANVVVQIVSQQTTATVISGAFSTGSIAAQATFTVPQPFRIQLSSSVAVGTTLNFDIVTQATGQNPVHTAATVLVQATRGFATANANFSCGEIKADPARNLVYAADLTNNRLLAINTDTGHLAAVASLNATSGAGQMAISPDDSMLYLALPTAQQIQVFSLPSLTPLGSLPVNFTPGSLACGTGGRLYAGSSSSNWGSVYEVNTTNGQIVQTFSGGFGGFNQFYAPLLRTSLDGTKLYIAETEISGYTYAYQYDISGTSESFIKEWEFDNENLIDFAVDDANNRLYLMNGGIYGVNVLDLTTGSYSAVWPLGSAYGIGVALLPTGTSVYGASGDIYSGGIVEYDRASGTSLRTYNVGGYAVAIQHRGIAITPNGNVLYVESGVSGGNATFGLIGGTTLDVTTPPTVTSGFSLALSTVSFSDTSGNNDGTPNSGEVITLTPTIANYGELVAPNVTVTLGCDSNAALVSAGSQAISSVAAGQTSATPAAFGVQLSSTLQAGAAVHFTFTVTTNGGASQSFPYTLIIQPVHTLNSATTNLTLGEILADPLRNVVYLVDKGDMEILAFDTDAGHITTTAPFGSQAVNWNNQASGGMAESVNGSYLYVAIPQSNMIQEYSLPGLTSVAQWTYPFQPVSMACDAQGRLYCSTTDSTQSLVQIDGSSGAVLSHSGEAFVTTTADTGSGTILRRNAAGTELYASLAGPNYSQVSQIYRYSTTGSGAPVQVGAASTGGIADYVVDESRSQYDVIESNGGVMPLPFSGAAAGLPWQFSSTSYGGDSVSFLPNGTGVLAGMNYSPGSIAFFSPSTGQLISTYNLNDNYYTLKPRGLASTPNGRTLYVASEYVPGGNTTSADGYDYKVGLIGGTIDMTVPGPQAIGLQSVAVTDPTGSNDGYVHPGQTVSIAPVFKNFLNNQITAVSVQLTTSDTVSMVNPPNTRSIGSVASFATFSPSPSFSIAISASETDGHAIPLEFTVTYNNGTQQTLPYTLYVTSVKQAEVQVNFQIGDMLSDPTRDLAYVVDNTHHQLLAINTDSGALVKTVRLASSPGVGHLALSHDGLHLYVALSAAEQIQCISLPDLQQSDIINLDFEPCSLAVGLDGKICASSADNAWEPLRQIDPASGKTLGTFGNGTYYQGSVLRLSGDGSTLYVAETGLSGFGSIDAFTINTVGSPTYSKSYAFTLENLFDLAVDDAYQRIYSVSGGTYGVGVTDMVKGTTTTWSDSSTYAPYGDAISFLPAGNFIYGGSYGEIRRYNRVDGTPLGDFAFSDGNEELMPRGMALSANGRVLFATEEWTGNTNVGIAGYIYRLGLIGNSTMSIGAPPIAPTIYAGQDLSVKLSQSAALSASTTGSTTNLPVTWRVVSGPSGASLSSTSASFSSPGTYQLAASTTDGTLTASDEINITVAPDSAAVSVAASVPDAIAGASNGQLVFNRTGTTSGALSVSYVVAGTARSGIDYTALPGVITIPDGASSATVPVVASATASPNASVVVNIASSANYSLGLSPQASVALVAPTSYQSWVNSTLSGFTAALQAPNAISSPDGVPNLLKYAFNISSSAPTVQGLPTSNIVSPGDGQNYISIRFIERPNATDLIYTVEVSSDMVNWDSGASATIPVSTSSNADGTSTVVIRDLTPASTGHNRFIRVQVSQP